MSLTLFYPTIGFIESRFIQKREKTSNGLIAQVSKRINYSSIMRLVSGMNQRVRVN